MKVKPGSKSNDYFLKTEQYQKEYGEKICLHGTIDTQKILNFGSEKDIIKEVNGKIDKLSDEEIEELGIREQG